MQRIYAAVLAGALSAMPALLSAGAGIGVASAYDLVFRTGTLDGLPAGTGLVYRREALNAMRPAAGEGGGEIRLSLPPEARGEAALVLVRGERVRRIGRFPAEVGNPLAMYFAEELVRDMSDTLGGSPFYIRNRLKEALARPADARQVAAVWNGAGIAAEEVVLHPFADDPARARMGPFAGLEIVVTVSEAVPGWYLGLAATASGADGAAVYVSRLVLDRAEAGR